MSKALFLLLFLFFITHFGLLAQNRFHGHYPLCSPIHKLDAKEEYRRALGAMAGGIQILAKGVPKKREDPESLIREDYEEQIQNLADYALSVLPKEEQSNKTEALKRINKAWRANKFDQALEALEKEGAEIKGQPSLAYFIWVDYLGDLRDSMPWTLPRNLEISRVYRNMLHHVAKNHQKPFGPLAEQGAVSADAAQALSNMLESPRNLSWKGEKQAQVSAEEQIGRLAACVAYLEWRLHDPTAAQRSALIDKSKTQHIKKALYEVVRSTIEDSNTWYQDLIHGVNLQQLYDDTKAQGWKVDGVNARKRS